MVGRSDNGGGGGLAGKDRADFRNTHIVATWRVVATWRPDSGSGWSSLEECQRRARADWQWATE